MKKNIFIVFVIAIIGILLGLIFINCYNEMKLTSIIENINRDFDIERKYINKLPIKNSGTIFVSAKYKGAHGENYPADFNYKYQINEDNLILEDERGFNEVSLDKQILKLMRSLKGKEESLVKVVSKESNSKELNITLDVTHINKLLNTDYQKVYMKISKNILLQNNVNLYFDDEVINISDHTYQFNSKDKISTITLNKDNYSIKDNKGNNILIFNDEKKSKISVVTNKCTLYLETDYQNKWIIKTSTPASIYNGIDMDINFTDVEIVKQNELVLEDNPIIRYFSALK